MSVNEKRKKCSQSVSWFSSAAIEAQRDSLTLRWKLIIFEEITIIVLNVGDATKQDPEGDSK